MRKYLLLCFVVLTLAASGCAVGGEQAGTDGSQKDGAETGAQGEDSKITILLGNEPVSLDPIFNTGIPEYNIFINIGEGLFTTGENLGVVPVLAESYKIIDDLTWEFTLREGVVFHNGEPFDAEAVKYSYERTMNNDAVRQTNAEDLNLERMEIVDDHTIRFHTSIPTPHMLARMANDHYMVAPGHYAGKDVDFTGRNPIGTGPYKMKEWRPGDRIVLEANPDYWGGEPEIKEVVYRFVPEPGTQVAELLAGNADIVFGISPDDVSTLQANPNTTAVGISGGRRVFLGFRTQPSNLPTAKKEVRQAMNYGLDVDAIIDRLLAGTTERMTTMVNSPYQNPNVKKYHYNPELAKQLLAEAGYPDGFNITLDAYLGELTKDREFLQAIVDAYREYGISIELNIMERGAFGDMLKARDHHEMYLRGSGPAFDPAVDIDIFRPDHYNNGTLWQPEEFRKALEDVRTIMDPEKRLEASYKTQELIQEAATHVFLWNNPEIYGLSKRIKGFKPQGDERIRVKFLSIQ